ncbi:MAG: NAD(P)H-dependent oxidoreductase subunit E, partial [Eubacterium sp.]|nr:NAD(P)H-dependent oxidoreductase subunit E [Eubacterium sp.]
MYRSHVLVCGGTGCTSSGGIKVMEAFQECILEKGLEKEVSVVQTGCHGLCALGPIVIVYPDAVFYSRVQVEDVQEIVSEHLLKGRVVERLLYKEGDEKAEA